jgi:hypothetical protein
MHATVHVAADLLPIHDFKLRWGEPLLANKLLWLPAAADVHNALSNCYMIGPKHSPSCHTLQQPAAYVCCGHAEGWGAEGKPSQMHVEQSTASAHQRVSCLYSSLAAHNHASGILHNHTRTCSLHHIVAAPVCEQAIVVPSE